MNTDKLVRTTFVLDRPTHENLNYLADRMQASRSAIVRTLLEPTLADMAKLMRSVPDDPSQVDLRQLALAGLDMVDAVAAESGDALRELANG